MIETFVFSYNRGLHLANLLKSAQECAWPGHITVIDDQSDDRTTKRVLASVESRYDARVVVPQTDRSGKYGGFWANMEYAYSALATQKHVMFLQDDLQFVRPITQRDLDRLIELLEDPQLSPFLFPAFWWGARGQQQRHRAVCSYDSARDVYRWADDSSQPGFSDVAIFNRGRLREAGWRAGRPETESSAEAFRRFGAMSLHAAPFLAFVPFAPRFRNGQAWSRRMDVRRTVKPTALRILSARKSQAFVERDRTSLPVAADHLTISGMVRRRMLRSQYWES